MNNLEGIHEKIQRIDEKEYSLLVDFLKEIALNNTYQKRERYTKKTTYLKYFSRWISGPPEER